MLKIKRDINQSDFKIVDLHFVKSEYHFKWWVASARQLLVGENSI